MTEPSPGGWTSAVGPLPADLLAPAHPLLPAIDDLLARYESLRAAGFDGARAEAFAQSLAELRHSLTPPCSLCLIAGGEGCSSESCRGRA